MIETDTPEPASCPEAMQLTAALLLGIKPPYGYCPTPARRVVFLNARGPDPYEPEPEPAPPPHLESLPELVTSEEARHALGIGISTFESRRAGLELVPAGRKNRTRLWSREQVRALAAYRPDRSAAHG